MIAIPNMDKPQSCEECRFRTCFIKVNLKKYTCWLSGEECGKTDCPLIEIVQCKDCKWFELDVWGELNGIPLIVAHEMCKFWGDGCKTSQDGFCSYGERGTDEDENV